VVGENWGSERGNWILLCEWDVKSCTVVDIWWRFGTACCHHLHGFSTLEIATADYTVTPIPRHQVIRRHNPKDHNILIYWSDNLKTPPKFMISRYCIESSKCHSVKSTLRRNVFSGIIYRIWWAYQVILSYELSSSDGCQILLHYVPCL